MTETLKSLFEIVRGYPGPCELQMLLCLEDGARVALHSDGLRVQVNDEMRHRIDDLLGPGNLKLVTSANGGARA